MKMGVLASHPIQYQAPIFRELARQCDLTVYFAHKLTSADQAAAGFGVPFEWDTDLLSGYKHCFLKNISSRPDVSHFGGCDTPEIRNEIGKGGFDAFLVTGWHLKSYWQAIDGCKHARVPVMVRGDSQLAMQRGRVENIIKEISHRYIMSRFDALLAVGARSREYYLHYGADPKKIFFSPHCVDNAAFIASPSAAAMSARRDWGLGECSSIAIFSGKLIPRKNPVDVVRAVALCNRRPHVRIGVLMVGSGEMELEIRQAAVSLGVKAHLAGFVNQSLIAAYYHSADFLVLPSNGRETWGLVVNEAMACGLPCVVSDAVGCAPDLIEPGRTGEVYEMGNISEMADAIGRVLPNVKSPQTRDAVSAKIAAYTPRAAVRGIIDAAKAVARGAV